MSAPGLGRQQERPSQTGKALFATGASLDMDYSRICDIADALSDPRDRVLSATNGVFAGHFRKVR